jgi:ABC-type antimicrobial peptide transport system permease subunit
MTLIFSLATYIAMFLCLFSLVASMLSNIYEQSHEISVLRSIGLKQLTVLKIYTYEAFVLVMSSSLLGILIGFVMGGTLIAQRVLLTQLEIPFEPPLTILIYVFTGSILCAFISSWFPARRLMKVSIARIMKSVL